MKKILASIVGFLVLLVVGCGPGATGSGQVKEFDLDGRKISFAVPPAPWVEKVLEEEILPGELGDKKQSGETTHTPVGVAFTRPEESMNQRQDIDRDKNGKVTKTPIELENDQVTLDYIAMWVEKRDGERLKEEYIKVAGVNAFHMVFEIGKPDERSKGEQVHFTKDGTHYILSMVMPVKEYDSQVGYFQQMVSSFQILSSGGAVAKPAATP